MITYSRIDEPTSFRLLPMLPRSSLALPTLPSTLFSYSLLLLSYLSPTQCVTVYGPTGAVRSSISSTSTASSSAPAYTDGAAAFNGVVLNPPPVPVGFDTQRAFSLTLMDNVGDLVNSGAAPSIGQGGWFYGFSVEMSVVDMVGAYICVRVELFGRVRDAVDTVRYE